MQLSSMAESTHCLASVQMGIRLDGREPRDVRPVELELGLIAQANGSARLHMGATGGQISVLG